MGDLSWRSAPPRLGLLARWARRRNCFHHDNLTGETYVGRGVIIDYRKRYECSACGRVWII